MADTDKVDFGRSAELLHIVEKCAGHGPRLNALATAAMDELLKVNAALQDLATKKAEGERKAKAEADAKAQAKLDAQAAAEDKARVAPPTPTRRPEEPDARPPVYPSDSETATIADRRM